MKLFRKQTPVLIFSVYQHADPVSDRHNHDMVVAWLDDHSVPHKVVEGRYNTWHEQSIIVSAEDYAHTVSGIASEHNQSNVLYLDEYRKAYMLPVVALVAVVHPYPDNFANTDTFIGQWAVAAKLEDDSDYTYDPSTGLHYEVVK